MSNFKKIANTIDELDYSFVPVLRVSASEHEVYMIGDFPRTPFDYLVEKEESQVPSTLGIDQISRLRQIAHV